MTHDKIDLPDDDGSKPQAHDGIREAAQRLLNSARMEDVGLWRVGSHELRALETAVHAHETESNPGGTGLEQSPSDSGDGRRDSGLTPGGPGGGRALGVPISHEPHDDQRIKDWLRSLKRHLSYDGEWGPQDEEIANSILERHGSQQETAGEPK